MSIRLVGNDGSVFWFTHNNWKTLFWFAEQHDWERKGKLLPDEWDESLDWNENWEIVGGAQMNADDANLLADAVDRGVGDPQRRVLQAVVDERNAVLQKTFPDRKFEIVHFMEEWAKFIAFARKGGFRIDLTD